MNGTNWVMIMHCLYVLNIGILPGCDDNNSDDPQIDTGPDADTNTGTDAGTDANPGTVPEPVSRRCAVGEWETWKVPTTFDSVSGSHADNVYFTKSYSTYSDHPSIYHYLDGVLTEEDLSDWLDYASTNVWVSDTGEVFVADMRGGIAHFDGEKWTRSRPPAHRLHDVWVAQNGDVYMAGDYGIWHYTSDRWFPSLLGKTMVAVHGVGTDIVFAAGQGLHRYDGDTWEQVLEGDFNDLWVFSENDIFVAQSGGSIHHFDGNTWSGDHIPGNWLYLESIWGRAPDDVYALVWTKYDVEHFEGTGSCGVVRFDGKVWTSMESWDCGSGDDAMWGTAEGDLFVASGGYVRHFNGIDATPVNHMILPGSQRVRRPTQIWGTGPNDIFAVGDSIWHYDGASWEIQQEQAPNLFTGVSGTTPNNVVAIGEMGSVFRFDGSTWNEERSEPCPEINEIYGFTADNVYANCAYTKNILHFDGSDWEGIPIDLDFLDGSEQDSADFDQLHGVDPLNLYVGGSILYRSPKQGRVSAHPGLAHYDGQTWSHIETPNQYTVIDLWAVDKEELFLVDHSGWVHHYLHGAWDEAALEIESRGQLWANASDSVYLATDGGTIWYFDGAEWHQQYNAGNQQFLDIWGDNKGNLFVTTNQQTVLRCVAE